MESASPATSHPAPGRHDAAPPRLAYIDATAGIAGDMLLAALVDAGADLGAVQQVLDALVPGSVRLSQGTADRSGQRATTVDVEVLADDPPHRTWASIRELLERSRGNDTVPGRTIDLALDVFGRLAEAEGATHGIPADEVHFHEVGALDSLADVVGACEAWRQLAITTGAGSMIAVGSGRIRAAHGDIPVPVPAVVQLALGWPTVAGEILAPRGRHAPDQHHHADQGHHHDQGQGRVPEHVAGGPHSRGGRQVPAGVAAGIGELATPTGVALMRGLASTAGAQPSMLTEAVGVGAGTKDTPGRPNVVRVMIGRSTTEAPGAVSGAADVHDTPASAVQLEANVDDLDPRLWPGVVDTLLQRGALDAWLTPIVMKHGRPAVTVHALVREASVEEMAAVLMDRTGSLGVRMHRVERVIRTRDFAEVAVGGRPIAVKLARDERGAVVRREPEFRDVAAAARALGISEREMLQRARSAAADLPNRLTAPQI